MKQNLAVHRSYLKPSFNLPYTVAHGVTLLIVVAAFYLINFPNTNVYNNLLPQRNQQFQLSSYQQDYPVHKVGKSKILSLLLPGSLKSSSHSSNQN